MVTNRSLTIWSLKKLQWCWCQFLYVSDNLQNICGDAGYRSRYLSHAKRALYHLSYTPVVLDGEIRNQILQVMFISFLFRYFRFLCSLKYNCERFSTRVSILSVSVLSFYFETSLGIVLWYLEAFSKDYRTGMKEHRTHVLEQ